MSFGHEQLDVYRVALAQSEYGAAGIDADADTDSDPVGGGRATTAEQAVGADPLELACSPRNILRGRLNATALDGSTEGRGGAPVTFST